MAMVGVRMPRLTVDIDVEQINAHALQLPQAALVELADGLQERTETLAMMKRAETGFAEWNEEGEDIFDREAEARRASRIIVMAPMA